MCKILTEREQKSLDKGKLLLEQLTGRKVMLESRKDCTCCKDKKVIKESSDYSKQKEYIGYEVLCRDSEGSLKELIEYIKETGNTGHSFEIIVDPESEGEKKFFWDGDGADMISEIKPIEENKQNLQESNEQRGYFDWEYNVKTKELKKVGSGVCSELAIGEGYWNKATFLQAYNSGILKYRESPYRSKEEILEDVIGFDIKKYIGEK